MKIFVFGYNRFDTMSTSRMLEECGLDHTVLCHNPEDVEKFVAGKTAKRQRLVPTYKPRGLAYNRNFALDGMAVGEWALFLVDDFKEITELDNYDTEPSTDLNINTTDGTSAFAKRFKKQINFQQFINRCLECIIQADNEDCKLVGFSGFDNALFRSKKWKYNCLADGRCWLVKKTHLRFDENVQLIDDVCWTALNIMHFGKVIINQWILPDCKRYSAGAFGSIEERMPQKIKEAEYLVRTYPNQIRFAEKAGWPPNSHVTIIQTKKDFTAPKAINPFEL